MYEIIIDHSETANKCTIVPLKYRTDFKIMTLPAGTEKIGPLSASYLLHPDGRDFRTLIPSSQSDVNLSAIDSIWRRVPILLQRIKAPLPELVRLPREAVTAYPRKSRIPAEDPTGGLATIEALFLGAALLGRWDLSLLSEYAFAQEFLKLNSAWLIESGVSGAHPPASGIWPIPPGRSQVRNAATRRARRARLPKAERSN